MASGALSHESNPTASRRLPKWNLISLAVGLVGLQFGWAVQVGYVTKTVLQLGLDVRWTGVVWLAGPIAGIVMQPIVGVWSDRCTSRFGRRRPFIVAGAVVTVAALGAFGYASEIGAALHVSPLFIAIAAFWALDFALNASQGPLRALMADLAPAEQQQEGNAYFAFATGFGNVAGGALGSLQLSKIMPVFASDGQALYTLAMGIVTVAVAWCVINTRETPHEPLQSSRRAVSRVAYKSVASSERDGDDVESGREREEEEGGARADREGQPGGAASVSGVEARMDVGEAGNSARKFPASLSDAASSRSTATGSSGSQVSSAGHISGGPSLASSASVGEGSFSKPSSYSPRRLHENSSFIDVLRFAPHPFLDVFAMQCFTWFSYFCIFVYATSWVGADVYNGVSSAAKGSSGRELYDAGVRMGNRGLALQAVVSMASSLVIPGVVGRFSARTALIGGHLILGAMLSSTLLLHTASQGWIAALLLAATGVSWATTMTVPWGMASSAVLRAAPARAGQYLTLFNLSQCFPEIAVSAVSGGVIAHTGRQASVLGLGGAAAFGGALYVLVRGVGGGDFGDGKADSFQ